MWQERFQSLLMDENYLLAAVRYVEMNPVNAGLCEAPRDWRFSSARAHLEGKDDSLVRVSPMLSRIGNWRTYLADSDFGKETEKIRKHTRTGRPLGSDEFIHEIETLTGKTLVPRRPGPQPKRE